MANAADKSALLDQQQQQKEQQHRQQSPPDIFAPLGRSFEEELEQRLLLSNLLENNNNMGNSNIGPIAAAEGPYYRLSGEIIANQRMLFRSGSIIIMEGLWQNT